METFEGRIAVVTGGASGMGRQLVVQLAEAGCEVATCDLSTDELGDTRALALEANLSANVSTHECDVADAAAMADFRDSVCREHETDHVHLVFNNAGLAGAGSFVNESQEAWERCFDVCWGGVYNGTRSFLPLLIAADESHLVNTASVNSFWACLGPDRPNTAYSTAKFAVRGFTESLITDLRVNAPHVGVSVVMPGHIGTSIIENTLRHGAGDVDEATAEAMREMSAAFRDNAPVTAGEAASVILDGVRQRRWRILIGDDAYSLDRAVRADPDGAYDGYDYDEMAERAPAD